MKIKTEVLNEFLKAVKMAGDSELKEVVFDFTDTGLKIDAMNESQTNMSSGLLKKEAFTDYEAIGKIGIQEMSKIIRIMEGFSEPDIKVENNLLKVTEENRIFETELLNIEFINKSPDFNFKFDEGVQIPFKLEELKKFIDEISINGKWDTSLTITTDKDKKELILKNDGKYKFTRIYNIDNINDNIEVNFGVQFFDAVENLVTETIELTMKSDSPIKVVSKSDNYNVNLIVAPRVIDD